MAERLAGLFPDLRLEVYQGRHHLDPPHRAEPGRFARALRDLWERAEAAIRRPPDCHHAASPRGTREAIAPTSD